MMKENFHLDPVIRNTMEASSCLNPVRRSNSATPYVSIVIKTNNFTKRVWTKLLYSDLGNSKAG